MASAVADFRDHTLIPPLWSVIAHLGRLEMAQIAFPVLKDALIAQMKQIVYLVPSRMQ
eukprot:CAMPEP_0202940924 /NCGR_PEP_ID=MMETSP1395-20130829/1055_1 /ASSEMBLY_ACC=CAM_ASM_000871 /TAXON_ID=5961 /ORGANISM="Blepharisma japonicum, Strain Stock R1072" /LENGTH=57 /DNA_ID=CAMNT_0049635715 /DNA_START=1370 /DNA_END=1543 /DNA_ORIENTATION=+